MLKTYKYPQIPDQDKEGTGNVLLGVQDGESLTPLTLSTGGNNSAIISFTAVKFNQFKKEVDRIDLDTSLIAIDLTNNIYKVDGLTDYATALDNGVYRFEFQNDSNLWKTEYFKVIDFVTDTSFKISIDTALGTGDNFQLPLPSGPTYNFIVDWGDSSQDTITVYNQAETLHAYTGAFSGQITITGECGGWSFNNTGDKLKPTSIDQWGDVSLVNITGGFYGCTNISSTLPTLPDSLITIGVEAFRECTGLTGSLVIPSTTTNIDNSAFFNCSGFTGLLTIPNSVTKLGQTVFFGCSGFTGSLVIPDFVTLMGVSCFSGCSGFDGTLTISSNITTIGTSTFSGCSSFIGNLTIPSLVTTIGTFAFFNCSGFNGSFSIPDTVTSIGVSAFRNCSGLTGTLTVPSSTTTVSVNAFRSCSSFTTLVFQSTLTSIGDAAFLSCSGLTRVDSFPLAAPTVVGVALTLGGTARPLHIQTAGTSGYGISPWTDVATFSSIINDL